MRGWYTVQQRVRSDASADARKAQAQLLFAAALILGLTTFMLLYLASDSLDREKRGLIDRDLDQATVWFNNVLASETAVLGVAMQAVESRRDFEAAFLARDRAALRQLSAPIYTLLNQRHRVTHFYFHDVDRTVFLRAHEPGLFGDYVNRLTLEDAEQQQMSSAGVELGANGLTLRYVSPWWRDGALLGYLELGMEIGHTLRELEQSIGVQAVIALDAATLDRDSISDSGIADSTSYNFVGERLLVSFGSLRFAPSVRDIVAASAVAPVGQSLDFDANDEGRYLSAARTRLQGVRGPIGEVIFIKDVTDVIRASAATQNRYLLLIVGLGIISGLGFYFAISRAQTRLERLSDAMNNRLRQARASAKIGSWEAWETSHRFDLTEEAAAVLEWDGEARTIPHRTLIRHVDAGDRRRLRFKMRETMRTGRELDEVVGFTTAENVHLSVRLRGLRMEDDEGRRISGTVQDVTDLKKAEERAVASEERQRAIIESTTDGIILIDDRGLMVEVNQAALSMFGYTKDELLNHNISVLMMGPHRDAHDDYIERYLHTGRSGLINTSRELEGRRKTGIAFPIRIGVGEVFVGGKRYFVGSLTDLTEFNRLELQLRHSQKMEAIGELSGGIAHDFNNILGIVIGQLDMMERAISDEGNLKRIRSAQRAVMRGADLSRKLLSFSRSSGGNAVPSDISRILSGMRELIERSLTSNIEVDWALEASLWPVSIDPNGLEDVLINLSINARDAMPEGGQLCIETRNITMSEQDAQRHARFAAGDWVELSVSDNGSGMPPEVLEKIYDPFFTTKKAQKGTGLGLSMVYGFVERANGAISVYSKPGLGTTFRITLPRDHSADAALGPAVDLHWLTELPQGNERVLVVDDEVELAEAAEAVLTRLGYTVHVVHSGEDALKLLASGESFDLVFSDVVMPGEVNGLVLARTLRDQYPDLPVILSSGYAGRINKDEGDGEWLDRLVAKPYRDHELARAVRDRLDAR